MTLLTVDEYRALHSTAVEDEALQLLLDAAEADIVAYAGADGSTVEWFSGGQRVIALASPAESITSIVENSVLWGNAATTLDATDYLVDPGGYLLYRDGNGTNPRWHWYGRVVVTYVPVGSAARRQVLQGELVNLTITYNPGVTSETVGSWTQLYQQSVGANQKEHDEILSSLVSHGRMSVVGGN